MVSDKKIFSCFSLSRPMENMWPPGQGHFWSQGDNLNKLGRCYIPNIKALGLKGSEKKIFKDFILNIYFSMCDLDMQWTRTIWNFNKKGHIRIIPAKFGQKSSQWFRKRCPLKQLLMTDDGYPTITIGRTEPLLQVAICLDLIFPIPNIIEMSQKLWEFWSAQGFHFKFHSREIILTGSKGEQPWLHATHCLVLICMHPNISKSIRVIEN